MDAITLGGVLVGKKIVHLRAGGEPVATRFCFSRCSHAYPTWLWPTLMIAVLVALWIVFLRAVIVRPMRRAAQTATGRERAPSKPDETIEHNQTAEGWYEVPYRLHQDRWVSMGVPAALVRDLGVEANDPPPMTPLNAPLVPTVDLRQPVPNGDDLRRVGDGGSCSYDPQAAGDAALDTSTWFPLN